MPPLLDFPPSPVVGQKYTGPNEVTYQWDGYAWTVGFYYSNTQSYNTVADLLTQVRVLLMDTDVSSGEYRYTTETLIMALNQGLLEMYRIRPDIFLENNFVVPQFQAAFLMDDLVIERQYVPSLVYYVVGMAQLRDAEETTDARAGAFLAKFTSSLVAVA